MLFKSLRGQERRRRAGLDVSTGAHAGGDILLRYHVPAVSYWIILTPLRLACLLIRLISAPLFASSSPPHPQGARTAGRKGSSTNGLMHFLQQGSTASIWRVLSSFSSCKLVCWLRGMVADGIVGGDGAETALESLLIHKINYCEQSAVKLFFSFFLFCLAWKCKQNSKCIFVARLTAWTVPCRSFSLRLSVVCAAAKHIYSLCRSIMLFNPCGGRDPKEMQHSSVCLHLAYS